MKLFIDYSVFVSVEYLGKSSGQTLLDLTVLKFSEVCKFKHKSTFSKNISVSLQEEICLGATTTTFNWLKKRL